MSTILEAAGIYNQDGSISMTEERLVITVDMTDPDWKSKIKFKFRTPEQEVNESMDYEKTSAYFAEKLEEVAKLYIPLKQLMDEISNNLDLLWNVSTNHNSYVDVPEFITERFGDGELGWYSGLSVQEWFQDFYGDWQDVAILFDRPDGWFECDAESSHLNKWIAEIPEVVKFLIDRGE